ncbi:MAG: hypothetical protein Q4C83_02785 [Candidatus Saccharibacteria bacterium]|nr:hypothetical protein [Candidatus Saccharibacteria bacterium]
MNKTLKTILKTILKIAILLAIAYLAISSIYVYSHINFGKAPEIVGMGYSTSKNQIRAFMGLPATTNTYEGVPPTYLKQVFVKIIIAVALLILFAILSKKPKTHK